MDSCRIDVLGKFGRYAETEPSTELGMCMVRWPYLSLSVADLDTCPLPLDNRYLALPVDRRQVNFLLSKTVLRRSSLWRDMSGGVANDPFTAYQEEAKVISVKKGSSSRSASGNEVMITGSHRSTVVKLEPSPSLPGKRPKSGGVTSRSVGPWGPPDLYLMVPATKVDLCVSMHGTMQGTEPRSTRSLMEARSLGSTGL
ncbi:hypothetical protein YC2023_016947 [Brassica napus]